MALYEFEGKRPELDAGVWIANSAHVIGQVYLGMNSSVWFGAIIRGDNEPICIGQNVNIQETAVLHSDAGFPLTIGSNVTIGHQAVVHGCTIGEGTLIGIGAVVLNGAKIGKNCLIGAGALVTEGKSFPDNSLIVGSPAVVKRELTDQQIKDLEASATHYASNAKRFMEGLRLIN